MLSQPTTTTPQSGEETWSRPPLSISGSGMDRPSTRRSRRALRYTALAAATVVVGIVVYVILHELATRSLVVEGNRVVISTVTDGVFEDFIPLRGRVTPRKTVFLDAVEGGRVEQVLVEDGATVRKGDLIAVLSNTSLQLQVTQSQALAAEQLNNMRTLELQLEQNRLQHKSALAEIDYQIKHLTRELSRQRHLSATGTARQSELQDVEDQLEYNQHRRELTLESQAADARMQETQLTFLHTTTSQLEENVAIARNNLEGLKVRAPINGKLSGFDIDIGQSIAPGGRLGQIDDPEDFKLTAGVDEFYLGRVDLEQKAEFDQGAGTASLRVAKTYPQVKNGQFDIDLIFVDAQPAGIRRGQTIQLKLTLGDEAQATLIPNGSFYQDTGGRWVFVVANDDNVAIRRNVTLGRRNSRYIEVLDGLKPGERVITSPYSSFIDMDRLQIRQAE
jgi:HlyD family secretion protein